MANHFLRSFLNMIAARRRQGQRVRRTLPTRQLQFDILEDRLVPSTLVVMNNLDNGPGSLRAVIGSAAKGDTIEFAKSLDVETIQVSIAHAYPGTELYEYAAKNGFITNKSMQDEGGHQMAHIEYPGLPADYVLEMVHRFYDEYYFRPKAAFRVVWKAIVNRDVPRLYAEAKSYLKLRAQRNRMVKEARSQQASPSTPVGAGA